MNRARLFDGHRQTRRRPWRIRRESSIAELRNRHHRRFVERAGRYLYAVPDVLAVGEGDEAGAGGWHGNIVSPWRRKGEIHLKGTPTDTDV